uniref:ATP synthase F0 subunit 8 n=1 Tax=Taiwanaptera montana TaxID=3135762 RepID=UPI0031F457C3
MPQMSPMYWMALLVILVFTLILTNTLIYTMNSFNTKTTKTLIHKSQNDNWVW